MAKSLAARYQAQMAACTFCLCDESGVPVPCKAWSSLDDSGLFAFTAVLSGLLQSGVATLLADGASVSVEADFVSRLDDDTAAALTLPGPVAYILDVTALWRLGTLRLETRWVDSNGLRLRGSSRVGCILSVGDNAFRLAAPFFEVFERIDAFNVRGDAAPADQARDWSDIQELVGLEPQQIHPSPFLSRMRVARANRFTLDFVPGDDGGFQIAPVPLMASSVSKRGVEDLGPAEAPPAEPKRLLTSAEQERFQRAFRARLEVQGQYLGGDDVYVLLSPEVKRSLDIVRRMQGRPPAERLEFARNPFPFLKESESDLEPPFCESRSFSDRVIGLGLLEKVTLPWQILGTQGWLPPRTVRLEVGSSSLDIAPAAIEPAIVDVEFAMANGQGTAAVGDHTLPASADLRDALFRARSELDSRAMAEMPRQTDERQAREASSRVGLQLRRNLEEAKYAARNEKRREITPELPLIVTTLKTHQIDAVSWLQRRWLNGKRGALLADDMGLGKSLSTLAFMIWLRKAMLEEAIPVRPVLIVAPVSLLENWQDEHAKHIGSSPHAFVDIVRAYGSGLPRRAAGRDIDTGTVVLDIEKLIVDRFGKPTCLLTTYETLRDYQQSFAAVHFGLVVLDEAQRIKNPASLTWHAISAMNADFWVALTGTPVENRVADIWAIADAIEPGLLGSLRLFSARYEKQFDEEALLDLKASLETSPDGAPFMLRRLKSQVLDGLPTKHEHLHLRPMPAVQSCAYDEVVASAHDTIAPRQMLEVVQRLREISLHPLRPTECAPDAYINASARFQSLFAILDKIHAASEKALVFVDRNIVEAYLAALLQSRFHLPSLPPIINGTVPAPKRKALVDAFQNASGFDVMILSPKAGGVGLTLTAANHAIHLSRWWNPAVEDQSTDRVYRIGQRREVTFTTSRPCCPQIQGRASMNGCTSCSNENAD